MRLRVVFCAVLLMLARGGTAALAQDPDEPLGRNLGAYRDTIDTFQPPPFDLRAFVVPGSERIVLDGTRLDTTAYRLDPRYGRLWIHRPRLDPDAELVAVYRTYPFAFKDVYRRRAADSSQVGPAGAGDVVVIEDEPDAAAEGGGPVDPFEGLQLQRSGSISRGIIGGSNRDVNIESGLRLQLDGEIAEGVSVRAALTDQNTPIQPEGTTQRLRDFDRVFVTIDAPQGTARLGDVQVDFARSAFGRFSRKLQGAALSTADLGAATPGLSSGHVTAVGAVTRGIYRTQDLAPTDGVQGPYRLEGEDGERFIVVIAGSETVYLDGQALTRGETNDYVIDYAQAEIAFTSNQLITEDQRITVEFEYTTTGFNRTLLGTEATAGLWGRGEGQNPRLTVGATVLREADSRDFSTAFDLSPADSTLLAAAGDEAAVRSGAERVTFDPEAPFVQYRRATRMGPDGAVDTVFTALEAAPPDSVAVFRVRFSRVGEGQGSYERVGRSVNGIVYAFRGPGNGDYAPVRRLPQPIQQQLFDLNGQLEPVEGVQLFGEWARSLNDQNRLSDLDAANDQGTAYRAGLRLQPTPLQWRATGLGAVSGTVSREQRSDHFTTFNRTRPVEFGRRWNLAARGFDPAAQRGQRETVDEAEVQWALTPQSAIGGAWGRLNLGEAFTGERRAVNIRTHEAGGPGLDYRLEYITSEDTQNRLDGAWLRQRGALRKSWLGGRLTPRLEIEQERRRQRVMDTDSLARASFSFVEYRPGLQYQAGALNAGSSVEYRTERDWMAGTLRKAATAWTVQSRLTYNPSGPFRSQARLGYQRRAFTDDFRVNQQREDTESVILQLQSSAQPFGRMLEIEGLYDALTERTPTLQEIYVRTGPELGQFVWTDSNGDGLVQIDEFVPETTPNEGAYVQRFVPSDSLTPVISVQARLRMGLRPARQWRSAEAAWKRWLAKASTQTTLEVREKSRSRDLAAIYGLDLSQFRDATNTLDGQLRIGQDLNLFRRSLQYGLDVSFRQVRGLSERAAGQQTRFLNQWEVEGRYRPAPDWGLKLQGRLGTDRLDSEAFADARQYDISTVELEPEVSYRGLRSLQITGRGMFARKRDKSGERTAQVIKLPLEVQYRQAGRFQISGRGEVARVNLDGDAVGLAAFELTDGRGPGTSFLWQVSGQYRINDLLRADVSYDGRAPANAPIINTLRMQLSAQF